MTRRMIVAMLALAGIFVATYLLLYKLGMVGHLTCSIGSCEAVNTSKWAIFLGIPVAAWGVGFYVVLFALALVSTTERYAESRGMAQLMVALAGTGVLFSAWLTWLEAYRVHAFCQWCVTSAILVTVIFIISVLELRETPAVV